jgi:ribosomal protein L37AE/L43A
MTALAFALLLCALPLIATFVIADAQRHADAPAARARAPRCPHCGSVIHQRAVIAGHIVACCDDCDWTTIPSAATETRPAYRPAHRLVHGH